MTAQPMSHDEALELSGLYALDALTTDEKAEVDAHLSACPLDHSEFAQLGGVTPAVASLAEPVGAPAALKRRVLDAYRDDVVMPASATDTVAPARRSQLPNWMGWAAAGLAVLLLAVLGVVGLNLKNQADLANQRADQMAAAVAALTAPGSEVAILHGTGSAADVTGFVAFPTSGTGYMVMTGVPAAPAGQTYQAWYIAGGAKVSAGTMTTDENGNVLASGLQPAAGTQAVAVTVEPSGGSDQPTTDPIIVGLVSARS